MSYIEIEKGEDGITMKLTEAGREELRDLRTEEGEWAKGTDAILLDLLEDHLANGLDVIQPEEIGALTSALILSDTVVRNDNGEIVSVETVYWFPDYAIRSEVNDLWDDGEVIFLAARK